MFIAPFLKILTRGRGWRGWGERETSVAACACADWGWNCNLFGVGMMLQRMSHLAARAQWVKNKLLSTYIYESLLLLTSKNIDYYVQVRLSKPYSLTFCKATT